MRRSRDRFSGSVASCRMPWLASFITSTLESLFCTHKHRPFWSPGAFIGAHLLRYQDFSTIETSVDSTSNHFNRLAT